MGVVSPVRDIELGAGRCTLTGEGL